MSTFLFFPVSLNDILVLVALLISKQTYRPLQANKATTRHHFHLLLCPVQAKLDLRLEKVACVHGSLSRSCHPSDNQFRVVITLQVGMCSQMEKFKPERNVEELRGVLARGSAGQREVSGEKLVLHALINY
jgi:hypothetical protein